MRNVIFKYLGEENTEALQQAFSHLQEAIDTAREDDGRGNRYARRRMLALRYYLRRLITEQPFIKKRLDGKITVVNTNTHECTAVIQGETGPVDHIKYYPPTTPPKVNERYTVNFEHKLPTKTMDENSGFEDGERWIKTIPGVVLWLYGRFRGGTMYRVRWPLVKDDPQHTSYDFETAVIIDEDGGTNGQVGGFGTPGLLGYHVPSRSIYFVNSRWRQSLSEPGNDTHISIYGKWGIGDPTLARAPGLMDVVSVNPDEDTENPERVWLGGALTELETSHYEGTEASPGDTVYKRWFRLAVSSNSGASWEFVSDRMSQERELLPRFPFIRTVVDGTINFPQSAFTLASGEGAGIGQAGNNITAFTPLKTNPRLADLNTTARADIEFRPRIHQGQAQLFSFDPPFQSGARSRRSYVGPTTDGKLWTYQQLLINRGSGPEDVVYRGVSADTLSWRWIEMPVMRLFAVSRDGVNAFGHNGTEWVTTEDNGEHWKAAPLVWQSRFNIVGHVNSDFILVSIPAGDKQAEEFVEEQD